MQQNFELETETSLSNLEARTSNMQESQVEYQEETNRKLDDIQKTLDMMNFARRLNNPKKMAGWLKSYGFDNFEVIKILNKLNKGRKNRK